MVHSDAPSVRWVLTPAQLESVPERRTQSNVMPQASFTKRAKGQSCCHARIPSETAVSSVSSLFGTSLHMLSGSSLLVPDPVICGGLTVLHCP